MTVTMALVPTVQASDITVKVNGEEIHPEMAPVIAENAAIKPDEPEQPAEVQSEVKAEEPEAEAKPAKRTRRPNRNSQKRTRKPVKKDAEE